MSIKPGMQNLLPPEAQGILLASETSRVLDHAHAHASCAQAWRPVEQHYARNK